MLSGRPEFRTPARAAKKDSTPPARATAVAFARISIFVKHPLEVRFVTGPEHAYLQSYYSSGAGDRTP